ncbi:hypothetical protein LWI28_008426 [Acer negundo]|uniref:Uncharacterized protein n=1 Tax=Acer negundo TaxID=4023 RepID=A0AAD5J3G5_ACENE|nr:hypothetical protein LWI28_008426 [Acer negundo]
MTVVHNCRPLPVDVTNYNDHPLEPVNAAWTDRSSPSTLRPVLCSNSNTAISFQFSETGCFMVMIFES